MIYIAIAGWVLAVLSIVLYVGIKEGILLFIYGAATICLLVQYSFPKRTKGLLFSFVGPIFVAANHIFANIAMKGCTGAVTLNNGISSCVLYTFLFPSLCFIATIIWMIRWYGFIPLLAFAAIIYPRKAISFRMMADEYPWKYWWIIVFMISIPMLAMFLVLKLQL